MSYHDEYLVQGVSAGTGGDDQVGGCPEECPDQQPQEHRRLPGGLHKDGDDQLWD